MFPKSLRPVQSLRGSRGDTQMTPILSRACDLLPPVRYPSPPLCMQNQSSKGLSSVFAEFSHFGPQYVPIPKLKSAHIVVIFSIRVDFARLSAHLSTWICRRVPLEGLEPIAGAGRRTIADWLLHKTLVPSDTEKTYDSTDTAGRKERSSFIRCSRKFSN